MSLSPSETTRLLHSLDIRPSKKLGQNFLVDGNIVKKSIVMAKLQPKEVVLEIGPGLGTLTEALLELNQVVHAVEIDSRLFKHLQNKFEDSIKSKKFFPILADAVKSPIGSIPENCSRFKIVANLPYAIASHWMEALLASGNIPESMTLMLQKEAAERILAQACCKKYNALAIFLKGSFSPGQIHFVPSQCFYPTPAVDSVLLQLNREKCPFLFSKTSRSLIRGIFTQRRKQIGSVAKGRECNERERIQNWLEKMDLSPTLRPEQIPPDAWQELETELNS